MKTRHVPLRSCVVCRQTSDKKTLLRVVRAPEKDGGGVSADATGRANGRGAYVCAASECIDKAIKQKRFDRAFKASAPPSLGDDLKALAGKAAEMTATTIEKTTVKTTAAPTTGATAL